MGNKQVKKYPGADENLKITFLEECPLIIVKCLDCGATTMVSHDYINKHLLFVCQCKQKSNLKSVQNRLKNESQLKETEIIRKLIL